MAFHLRRQIRDAVATALTGLGTTGARVFTSRVYELAATDLPALSIETLSETVEVSDLTFPRLLRRTVRLQVSVHARATADTDDVLDQASKEVEAALAMPCAALAGIAKFITLLTTDIRFDGSGEQPRGQADLVFEVQYFANENAPDVAL